MNVHRKAPRLCASTLAVQGAIGMMAATATAHAESDRELLELTQPRSSVELGIANPGSYSAKANEWSGRRGGGSYGIAGFDLQFGDAYDGQGTRRWRLRGSDLGTEVRSLAADGGEQGWYRIRLGYEELLRNQSDSFQTPYLGVGGNLLTLPANWLVPVVPRLSPTALNARGLSPAVTASNGIVAGVSTAPTAAQLAQAAAVQAADLPAFHHTDLSSKRTRFGLAWDLEIDARWSFQAAVTSEHKQGLKALTGHADAPAETSTVLPQPINQDDERLHVGVGYTGDALQLQLAYDLSAFTNNVPFVGWTVWSQPGSTANPTVATMSNGAPSNTFQKFTASASYRFSPDTRLTAHVSYARTAQDEAFPTDDSSRGTLAAGYVLPRNSAQALVVNQSAGFKLLNRTSRNLSLSLGAKVDARENRTPVDTYIYYDNNTAPAATPSPFAGLYGNPAGLGSNVNINANTPYGKRVSQVDAEATYQLGAGQRIKAGASSANTHRHCSGTWIDCANAGDSTENVLHGDWRGPLGEAFSASLGLTAARRRVDYNELAFLARVPMAGRSPSTATGALAGTTAYGTLQALGLSGYGRSLGLLPAPTAGSAEAFYFTPAGTGNVNNPLQQLYYGNRNRMVEENGLRTFDQASRKRNQARATLLWQLSEALSLQAAAEYAEDHYDQSRYGLQRARTGALHLDLGYTPGEDTSVGVFASLEDQRARMTGNSIQTAVNSTAVNVNGVTAIAGDGACNTTIGARNASYKIDPCMDWSLQAHDRTQTLGASLTRRRLLKGKLDLAATAVYSKGTSDNDVGGGFYVNNPYAGITGATTRDIAAYFIQAGAFPANLAKSAELRLSGTYHLDRDQDLRAGYSYRRLASRDWGYEGMQPGALVVNLPTFETAPHYRVHAVGVSYSFGFR